MNSVIRILRSVGFKNRYAKFILTGFVLAARPKYGVLSDQLIAFEIENQRLQRELLIMQEKGMVKDKDNKEKDSEGGSDL